MVSPCFMVPLTLLPHHLLLLFIHLAFFPLAFIELVVLVSRPVAAMFQVCLSVRSLRLDADLSSASATPSTLGLQRNRPARKRHRTISLDPNPPVVRHQVPTPPAKGPQDETAAPPSAVPTPKNSKLSLRSEMMMNPVARVRLARRPPTLFPK